MPHLRRRAVAACVPVALALFGCAKRTSEPPASKREATVAPSVPAEPKPSLPSLPPRYTFAVVGDYGSQDAREAAVAKLVKSWQPAFVVTTGDNIYPDGGADYDLAIGAFYAEFIGAYKGRAGAGSMRNRFWPSPGNHDWAGNENLENYRAYFTLPEGPGGERYYDVALDDEGLAHLYVVDSDPHEPDGIDASSKQAAWLRERLAANATAACFHLVAFHHPPYTTLTGHGPAGALRWPFKSWGADLVLSGHNHHYERLVVDGLTYLISGTGGAHLYDHRAPSPPESVFFDDTHHGALRVSVARGELFVEAMAVGEEKARDRFLLGKSCPK